jgi:hypothetical protein
MTIVKSVVLPLSPGAAFDLFTLRAGAWWPVDRRHTQDPASEIFFIPSGRFYERARDGREVELGHVRAWDRPNRILLDFFPATGPERPTEVEIAFAARGRHRGHGDPPAEAGERGAVARARAALRAKLGPRIGGDGAHGGLRFVTFMLPL